MSRTKEPVEAQGETAEEPKTEEQPAKRRMPVRIVPVEIEEGAFEGWKFTANRNFTFKEMEELSSFNYMRMWTALRTVVTSWENFVDRDGEPIKFVPLEEIEAQHAAYLEWRGKRDAGGAKLAPMSEPYDPWSEVTADLAYVMSLAILGLPLPNR